MIVLLCGVRCMLGLRRTCSLFMALRVGGTCSEGSFLHTIACVIRCRSFVPAIAWIFGFRFIDLILSGPAGKGWMSM